MAKTLRTSGDYLIKAGSGAGGTNSVTIDSKDLRVLGDLTVDGTNTVLNTASLSIEDAQIILARNNSGSDVDAGIIITRHSIGTKGTMFSKRSPQLQLQQQQLQIQHLQILERLIHLMHKTSLLKITSTQQAAVLKLILLVMILQQWL